MDDIRTRDLSAEAARTLSPGADHYTAYVGPPAQWDFMGATQFRLLTTLGLRQDHKVLDVGCGSLRAGRFLVMYLAAGHYFGIEPNRWLVEDAIARELGPSLVEMKKPNFLHVDDFGADRFGETFDFIVAQSIFSHAGPELVEKAFDQFARTLKDDGLALVTFIHPEQAPSVPVAAPGWTYPGCVTYPPQRIMDLVAGAGLFGRRLPWYHPRQSWYALARNGAALPPPEFDRFLAGAVLRDPEFAASTAQV